MLGKLIWKDLLKNKLSSITLLVFMTVAIMLMSTAVQLTNNLFSSISGFVTSAKTPHMVQMHTGDIDEQRLAQFVADHPTISAYQVTDFLNLDGSLIVIDDQSLASSVQDNGLAVQSREFDFLLDLNNQPIKAKPGEIYLPLVNQVEGKAKLGSRIEIAGKPFILKGFVRDSQMNSTLSLSKRFVVHASDFEDLLEAGSLERIITFRVSDRDSISTIQKDYIEEGLEANGPPMIVAPFLEIINGASDGLMIILLGLVSLIVLLLSFLCLRFILLAKIEEDYTEIGVLKALGIPLKRIKAIYLYKYGTIALLSLFLGYFLSLGISRPFQANIELYMGRSQAQGPSLILGFLAAFLLVLMILLYLKGLLKGFGKISAAQAIRFGAPEEVGKAGKKIRLSQSKLSVAGFLALKDSLTSLKRYATIFFVITFAFLMTALPISIYQTFASEDFVTYMGLGKYDLRLDLANLPNMEQTAIKIEKSFKENDKLEQFGQFRTRLYDVQLGDKTKKMRIESGDHNLFPIVYANGRAPQTASEIALSSLNANEIEKTVGDKLSVVIDKKTVDMTITGIYSDITYGGTTAKMIAEDQEAPLLWLIMPLSYKAGSNLAAEQQALQTAFPEAKVALTETFIQGIFGQTISVIQRLALIASIIALVLIFILTLLFMRLLLSQERQKVATLRALGFRRSLLAEKFQLSALVIAGLGLLLGLGLVHLIGGQIALLLLSQFGVSQISLQVPYLLTHLLLPTLFLGTVALATKIAMRALAGLNIAIFIKE